MNKHGDNRFSNIKELDAEQEEDQSEEFTTEESVGQENKVSGINISNKNQDLVTELENMFIRDADDEEKEEFRQQVEYKLREQSSKKKLDIQKDFSRCSLLQMTPRESMVDYDAGFESYRSSNNQ